MSCRNALVSILLIVLCSTQVVRAVDTGPYRLQRSLSGVHDQWHRIVIPPAVLAKSKPELSDLRVVGIRPAHDTVECPYLLNIRDDRTSARRLPCTMINKGRSDGEYRCTLVTSDTLSANLIGLEVSAFRTFTADVRVEGSVDNRSWTTITKTLIWRQFDANRSEDTTFSLAFHPSRYSYYRISLHSFDSLEIVDGVLSMTTTVTGQYDDAEVASQNTYNDQKNHQTVVDVALQSPLNVSVVQIQTAFHGDFERPMQIELLTDSVHSNGQWRYEYRTLWRGTISSLREWSFHVDPAYGRILRIKINNGDNIPISIQSVAVKYTRTELITRCENAEAYYLLYGQPTATAPNYDLASFSNNIPTDCAELQMGAEEARIISENKQSPLFENKLWLWAVMLLVIVALGGATFRMMRN